MRCLLLLAVVFLRQPTVAQDDPPLLEQRITDFTNTLSYAEWNSLAKETRAFEDTTSNQLAILLIRTTGDVPIEDYASRVFEQNRLGQAGKDNGVLIVVALDDRTVRIEVGYGLEGVLTDALTRKIIEKEMKPRFRDQQYYGGLIASVYAIAGAIGGEYTADERGVVAPMIGLALMAAVLIVLAVAMRTRKGRRMTVITGAGPTYHSGWGWTPGGFGGRSGGGFGGFSGGGFSGGGGMSGGGGATGSW